MSPIEKKLKDKGFFKGVVTFTNFLIEHPRAKEIDQELKHAHLISPLRYDSLLKELKDLCSVKKLVEHNMVVLTGRSVFARLLIADTTYTGAVNYGALGTASTAVTDADTVLDTEVARKGVARRVRTTDSVDFDFFYSQSDTDGTYEEFGMFIDGTATVDTGQLFNRLLTGGWTKTNTEAMTVSVQIDVNAA